jgi:hypothetical protein
VIAITNSGDTLPQDTNNGPDCEINDTDNNFPDFTESDLPGWKNVDVVSMLEQRLGIDARDITE